MSNNRIVPQDRPVKDKLLGGAIEQAREAILEVTKESNVGSHAGMLQESDRVITHAFECLLPGYKGWFWTVTLARAPRAKKITVSEVVMRPGPDALLAPTWIPWSDRLKPSDILPSDRLPYNPDDPHLEQVEDPLLDQGFEATGIDADASAVFELGLGRKRVMSDAGRAATFRRWYRGEGGPRNQATRDAKAPCATCGYFLRMDGSARAMFGVCGNEWSAFDGRVVSLDHGCGSHSETDIPRRTPLWDPSEPVLNDRDLEIIEEN
ncbi:DUF3027 domain-containing protein [Arcanobacterium canis]